MAAPRSARAWVEPARRLAAHLALVLVGAAVTPPAFAQREPGWDLRIAERVDIAAGATAPLTIAIAVDRGLTVSRDADVIVDLDPEVGLTIKKKRIGRRDAVDPDADAPRFSINVRSDASGDHRLRLRVRFWLCSEKACRPIDVQRVVAVSTGTVSLLSRFH